jgi:hypothetical protein
MELENYSFIEQMNRIELVFISNVKGIYTKHIETCTNEYLGFKLLRMVNYWFNVFCKNDQYDISTDDVPELFETVVEINEDQQKELNLKWFMIQQHIDILNDHNDIGKENCRLDMNLTKL